MTAARQARSAALAATLPLFMGGCAVVPTVDYHTLREGVRRDNWVLFRLTDSVIVVGASGRSAEMEGGKSSMSTPPVSLARETVACGPKLCALATTAAPTDDERAVLALEPRSKRLISTSLSATYQPNSLRLKVLTVEAKDHRLEAINTIGAIALGAAKSTTRTVSDKTEGAEETEAPAATSLRVPFTIDLADARCAYEKTRCVSAVIADPAGPDSAGSPRPVPNNPGWSYDLRFIDNPKKSGFVARADLDGVHGAMIGSICRPLLLELKTTAAGAKPVVFTVQVADPEWLETAPFPTKGAVTFQNLCGLDVQADAVVTVGTDALATAFFNNVAAVRASQKN